MSVCAGKTRFPTFAAARNHAKKARRRHEEPFNAYHCNECGAYHYGARPLDKGRAARLRKARALLAEVIDRPAVIRRGRAARAAAFARGIRRNGWWVKRPDADPPLVRVFDAQDLATMQRLYSNAELTPE